MSIEEKVYHTIVRLKHIDDLDLLADYVHDIIIRFKEDVKSALGPSCEYVENRSKLKSLLCKEKLDEENVKKGTSN